MQKKILHFSDTHLGFVNYDYVNDAGVNVREQDFYDAFAHIVDIIVGNKPDLVLHTGDFFHRPSPSNRAITFAMQQLCRISAAQINMVIIAGNHSTPRTAFTTPILELFAELPYVHCVCQQRYEVLNFDGINIHGLPHINDLEVQRMEIEKMQVVDNQHNILMLHTSLGKDYMMQEYGEKMFPDEKYDMLNTFDYIALGHWHNFQQVKVLKNAWYSGSAERLSETEIKHEKGFCWVYVNDETGVSAPHFVPMPTRKWLKFVVKNCFEKSVSQIFDALNALVQANDINASIVALVLENMDNMQSIEVQNQEVRKCFWGCFHIDIKRTTRITNGENVVENLEMNESLEDKFSNFIKNKTENDAEAEQIITKMQYYFNLLDK